MRDKRILLIFLAIIVLITLKTSFSYNFEYVNVSLEVNITDAYPEIYATSLPAIINLFAGTTTNVSCNVSVLDWNGFADITKVNATLWDNNNASMGDSDNPNNHYTNTNCSVISQNSFYANYTCNFTIWYYSNPSANWTCNATAIDTNNFTGHGYNKTNVTEFFAINVTSLIDYGNMVLGEISANITANITNIGNGQINVSLRGYGGFDPVIGNNLSMICWHGNISVENQRFSTTPQPWSAKTNLSSSLQNLTGVSIPKRIAAQTWNATYWQLYVDPTNSPFGVCNGTIEFTAFAG